MTVARATPRLPGGRSWWHRNGLGFRQWAVDLHHWPDEAWNAIGELRAEPAPDAFDINWPAHKVFRVVEVPPGARVGDTFVLGDGMGTVSGSLLLSATAGSVSRDTRTWGIRSTTSPTKACVRRAICSERSRSQLPRRSRRQ